jgi:hypothetical protein
MNVLDTTSGVVLGVRPGLSSGIALLSYSRAHASVAHPEIGYGLRGWVITNFTPDNLRSWVTSLAEQHRGQVLLAIDTPQLPSRHADALVARAHACGVPVVERPSLAVDAFATDTRIQAAHLHQVIKGRPLVRLATNQALFAAIHDWSWPDTIAA